jgi:hypothetical protein
VKRIDSLLGHLIKNLDIEDGVRLAEIRKNWQTLFRKPLPYHMAPSRLSGSDLLLNVDSPIWLQEMNIHREEILQKLTPFGVRSVKFRLGKVSTMTMSEVKSQKTKTRILNTEERSYIEQTISQINDDRLKKTVKTAIERAISSGKTRIL